MTQPEKIEHIINKGCEFFGLTREELLEKNLGTRGNIHRMKRYICFVILNEMEVTMDEVAHVHGLYNNKDCVSSSMKKMKEELSDEFYGSDKTKRVYKELLTHLGYEKQS